MGMLKCSCYVLGPYIILQEKGEMPDILFHADNLFLFVFQEVGLVDYHSHHARDYSSHLAQPHRRRPSLLSEFQPGNER